MCRSRERRCVIVRCPDVGTVTVRRLRPWSLQQGGSIAAACHHLLKHETRTPSSRTAKPVPGPACLAEFVARFFRSCSVASLARSEEHTSELQSLMRTSYSVFCLNKKNNPHNNTTQIISSPLYSSI